MISVEITKLKNSNGIRVSSRERLFVDYGEFKKYYELAKREKNTIINVRFYDALKDPMLAQRYDYIIQNQSNVPYVMMGRKDV